jgi:hypothetical protein
MKSIRLKYCTDNRCTFKFVNQNSVADLEILASTGGQVNLRLSLKVGEPILLTGSTESIEVISQRWQRFQTSVEIFFDLADYTIIK